MGSDEARMISTGATFKAGLGPRLDEYWGLCPTCQKPGAFFINVRKCHYNCCPDCKQAWFVGYNLFTTYWRMDDADLLADFGTTDRDKITDQQAAKLDDYTVWVGDDKVRGPIDPKTHGAVMTGGLAKRRPLTAEEHGPCPCCGQTTGRPVADGTPALRDWTQRVEKALDDALALIPDDGRAECFDAVEEWVRDRAREWYARRDARPALRPYRFERICEHHVGEVLGTRFRVHLADGRTVAGTGWWSFPKDAQSGGGAVRVPALSQDELERDGLDLDLWDDVREVAGEFWTLDETHKRLGIKSAAEVAEIMRRREAGTPVA